MRAPGRTWRTAIRTWTSAGYRSSRRFSAPIDNRIGATGRGCAGTSVDRPGCLRGRRSGVPPTWTFRLPQSIWTRRGVWAISMGAVVTEACASPGRPPGRGAAAQGDPLASLRSAAAPCARAAPGCSAASCGSSKSSHHSSVNSRSRPAFVYSRPSGSSHHRRIVLGDPSSSRRTPGACRSVRACRAPACDYHRLSTLCQFLACRNRLTKVTQSHFSDTRPSSIGAAAISRSSAKERRPPRPRRAR